MQFNVKKIKKFNETSERENLQYTVQDACVQKVRKCNESFDDDLRA